MGMVVQREYAMNRNRSALLGLFMLAAGVLAAWAESYRGEMNSWGATWMWQDTSFGSIWKITVTCTANDATSEFKFDQDGDWDPQWGTAAGYSTNAGKNATIGQSARQPGRTSSAGNLSFSTAVSGRRYTFCLKGDASWYDRRYVVMETDTDPAGIASVTTANIQDPWTSAVPIAIQWSTTPSTQESVWVRWSTNSFAGSSIVRATGSGTNYAVSLPAVAAGARVEFYLLTSTMPSNQITDDADLCTLRGFKSGTTNFAFRFGAANIWHIPTNEEPSGAYMRNPRTNAPATQAVYIYCGNQYAGSGNTGDMSSLTVYHRLKGSGAWNSGSGSYDSTSGNNKYWVYMIPADTYAPTNEVEYYLKATFTDHNTTFIGTTNDGVSSVTYLTESNAQTHPFTFRYAAPSTPTNLGNCWHHPFNAEPQGAYMRNPRNPYSNNTVYIYNGNQFQGSGTPGNQTGGTLYHRRVGSGTWTSTNLAFDSESGNNKYWYGVIPAGTYGATNEVEYYLRITYSDRDTTYLGTTNQTASLPFGTETNASANPFRFTYGGEPGTEAGFIWHASNRVTIGGGTVQFWVKIGYAQGTGSNRWVDHVCLYYTTNGTSPAIAGYGTNASAGTFVQALSFSHMEEDSFPDGDAMWWAATVTNLPTEDGSIIKYKIGAWKDGYTERFAEYNTDAQDNKEFAFSLFTAGASGLTVNGINADYTTTKFFIDEIAGETQYVYVVYTPPTGASNVQVFCNLNRRDLCDVDYTNAWIAADGYPDGIKPPNGNYITPADTGAYFTAFTMYGGPTTYYWTGVVSRCGAYRLTARYQLNATNAFDWKWYTSDGRRDHAIVVSPRKVHNLTMYEVNPLTVKATSDTSAGRSTFNTLLAGNPDTFTNFNLGYLNKLGVNCLWFQPIHPNAQERKDEYEPGSPYATRNYYAVSKWFGADGTEDGALAEFTNFVRQCDTYTGAVGSINIMLDGVFNHSAWDAVFGEAGVTMGFCTNANDRIGWFRPTWYALITDYGMPATYYHTAYSNDFAMAPDRGDFGKWFDVTEFFFGRYSALVRHNPENNGDYLNEDDIYDYAGMTATNEMDLWRFFAYYTEYWLKKTGHPGSNTWNEATDNLGIDGLRCDFGQGLPPQLWEYIINRTRHMKWNFLFMAETLDGGKPGYRSNRHFDVLNENLVFKFTQEHITRSWELKNALEDRRNAYRSGAILLNLTSHDEVMPDGDPWVTASRYGALSAVDGIPMIFYGQEWGIQPYYDGIPQKNAGFVHFELNFGKYIPHFKRWNKLTVWENPPDYSDGLPAWYARVNHARLQSPALRSLNRYFLSRMAGGDNEQIFAVAKYQTAYASPATSDVVLAFALMLGSPHDDAQDTFDLRPCWDLLGLDTGKYYNVRNLASSDPDAYLWPSNFSGQQLWDNGVYVHLTADQGGSAITNDGALVQYLKLEEFAPLSLTVNSAHGFPSPAVGTHSFVSGQTITNTVNSVTEPMAQYVVVGWTMTGNDPVSGTTNVFVMTLTNNATLTWRWQTNYWLAVEAGAHGSVNVSSGWQPFGSQVVVTAMADAYYHFTNWTGDVSGDDMYTNPLTIVVTGPKSVTAYFAENLTTNTGTPEWWLAQYGLTNNFAAEAAADQDSDGMETWAEYIAGTTPTNAASVFVITNIYGAASSGVRRIYVPTQPQRHYVIFYTDDLGTSPISFRGFGNTNIGIGSWFETNTAPSSFFFTDDETPNTTTNPPAAGRRFYRVRVSKP